MRKKKQVKSRPSKAVAAAQGFCGSESDEEWTPRLESDIKSKAVQQS